MSNRGKVLSIRNPEFAFVNCYGTHMVTVHSFFYPSRCAEETLLFLAGCNFQYRAEWPTGEEMYSKSPWAFQPLKLHDTTSTPLFSKHSLQSLLVFQEEHLNIGYERIGPNVESDHVIERVVGAVLQNAAVILSMDEYYNPMNSSYYHVGHNLHSVLVKGFNEEKQCFLVMDTEAPYEYELSFEEVKLSHSNSIYKKDHIVLFVNSGKFGLDYTRFSQMFFERNKLLPALSHYIHDLSKYLPTGDPEFMFKSIFYIVNFQIIPYVRLREHLMVQNEEFEQVLWKGSRKQAMQAVNMWTQFKLIIARRLKNKNWEHVNLLERLNSILAYEQAMEHNQN